MSRKDWKGVEQIEERKDWKGVERIRKEQKGLESMQKGLERSRKD